MKTSIHPSYNQIQVICNSCNTQFSIGSTATDNIYVDSCSNCHPFFTGTQKIVDIANKARDFAARQEKAKNLQEKIATQKSEKASKSKSSSSDNAPQTLKDMIKLLKQGE